MATVTKIVRVSNPRKRRRVAKKSNSTRRYRNSKGKFVKASVAKRNTRKRTVVKRKSNSPVIRRYSLKTLKREMKRRGVKSTSNPSRRRRYSRKRTVAKRRRNVRKQNPVLIELGSAINPRRRKHVARKRKYRKTRNSRRRRVTVARVRRVRVANPVRRRRYHRRRKNTGVARNRRRYSARRRNPAIFGRSGGKDLLVMVGGGLVGVAATKFLPTLLPSSITAGLSGMGPIASVVITGAGAFAAGMIARMLTKDQTFADAVMFGGLMQTGSVLLSTFAPASLSQRLALSGMGDIVPGSFVVPQNPIKAAQVFQIPVASGVGAWRRRW